MKLKTLLVALSVVVIAFGAWRGSTVPFAKQWPLYEALRTTAAIIFAVVGAWLAIAYPERLKMSLTKGATTQRTPGSAVRVGSLMTPIAHSTIILAMVLFIGIAAPLVREYEFVRQHVAYFRGFSYGLLAFLTMWQLGIVMLTLVPADAIKEAADSEEAQTEYVNSVFSGTKTQGGDDV